MKHDGFWTSARGNVTLIFGLGAVPLMLVVGGAIDYSRAITTRTSMQAAADAAALAAVRAKGSNAVRGQYGADLFQQQVALDPKLAKANPLVSVKVADDAATAEVTAIEPNLFLDLVGLTVNPIKVTAQAATANQRPVCMLALDEAASPGISLVGAAGITAPDCVVQTNSTAPNSISKQGAAKGTAQQFCTVGGYTANGQGFTPPPTGNCAKVEDPLASLPPPQPSDCTWTFGVGNPVPNNFDRPAGENACIEGIQLSMAGNRVFRLRGGTLHLIGNGSGLNITGNAVIDITAPTTGRYAGIAIAQHGVTVRGTSTITGTGDTNFTGTLHMPNQHIDMRGNGLISAGSPAWSIVAATFELRGTPDIVINSDFKAAGYGSAIVRTTGGVILVD